MSSFQAGGRDDAAREDRLHEALKRLGSRRVEERVGALGDLAEAADPRTLPQIAAALEDINEEVRLRAAYALGLVGGLEELLSAANHARPEVRDAAVAGLAYSPDPRAVEALSARVTDADTRIAANAVWELVRGGTERGLEVGLATALHSPEKAVRERAAQALEGFGNQHVPFLLRQLASPPEADAERLYTIVVNALLRNPHPDAVEPLVRLLETSIGPLREKVAHVLGKSGDPRAIPALRQALAAEDPRLRKEAALGLASLQDRESAPAIRELIGTRNMHVQVGAIQALGRLGDLKSVDAIGRAISDPQHLVRLAAVEVLPWLAGNDRRVVGHLCAALRDEHVKVRRAAADALRIQLPREAVPALQERLDQRIETDKQVRALAREALSRIQVTTPTDRVGGPDASAGSPIYTGTLTAHDPQLSTVGPVPTSLPCQSCGGPCHELLVVPGEQIGRAGRLFRVIRCLNCYFEEPYLVYFQGGQPTLVAYSYAENQEFFETPTEPPVVASIRWTPGPPQKERSAWGWETLAGGSPAWQQNGEWPQCPTCGQDMEFILQLASSGLDTAKAEDVDDKFYLSIENYATLYFFVCSGCDVTASVTECT